MQKRLTRTQHAFTKSVTFFLGVIPTFIACTLLLSVSASAHAQLVDFSPLATSFGVGSAASPPGTITGGQLSTDGNTIQFPLVQQGLSSLTINLNRTASQPGAESPIPAESAASGYVAITAITAKRFLVVGAFPVPVGNLPPFIIALKNANLPITAIGTETPGISGGPAIITVHVQATLAKTNVGELGTTLESVLSVIGDPQKNMSTITGPLAITGVPATFNQLLSEGAFSIPNLQAIVFTLPVQTSVALGGKTLASPEVNGLMGEASKVVISGLGVGVANVDLALPAAQVVSVTEMLATAGYDVSSEGSRFKDTPNLVFLHAAVVSFNQDQFYSQLEVLGNVLILLQ